MKINSTSAAFSTQNQHLVQEVDNPKTKQAKKTQSALYVQAKLMLFHICSKKIKSKVGQKSWQN